MSKTKPPAALEPSTATPISTPRMVPRTARYHASTLAALEKLAKARAKREGRTVLLTEELRHAAEAWAASS